MSAAAARCWLEAQPLLRYRHRPAVNAQSQHHASNFETPELLQCNCAQGTNISAPESAVDGVQPPSEPALPTYWGPAGSDNMIICLTAWQCSA